MGTLDGVAPPVDSPASESKKGIVLNEEEINADLGDDMGEEREDVLEIMDSGDVLPRLHTSCSLKSFLSSLCSDEEKNKGGLNSDEEADENSFSEIDHDNDHDMAEFYDNMDIEDITKPTRKKRTSLSASANGFSTSSKAKGKILETDFEDVQLARLAKSSVRLAICVDDMWPQEDKPSLKLLRNELGKMRNKDRLASLRKVTQSAEEKDKLIRFMNYASSQVRFDMSLPTRLLVTEYFQLSGGKGQPGAEEAARVTWLREGRKYHENVDVEKRTSDKKPFASPLIGKILRAHFVDSSSYQDKFLLKRMKATKMIPPRLIVMVATLIDHAISEWVGGTRTTIFLTRKNVEKRYRRLMRTMVKTEKRSPVYVELLSKALYKEMKDFDEEEDIPEYDYDQLESFAKEELKRLESMEAEEDVSDTDDDDDDDIDDVDEDLDDEDIEQFPSDDVAAKEEEAQEEAEEAEEEAEEEEEEEEVPVE
ncbi:hypothetical protein EV361DRAFT_980894 [Lentinula raphanica]|nr:hypothetical protein EV361DRAFT_980894 [Lentinula raphanica]